MPHGVGVLDIPHAHCQRVPLDGCGIAVGGLSLILLVALCCFLCLLRLSCKNDFGLKEQFYFGHVGERQQTVVKGEGRGWKSWQGPITATAP